MAANTPIIKPSNIKKAAKYCATRFSMFVQLAITMSTVVKVVSRISGIEMPSTPR